MDGVQHKMGYWAVYSAWVEIEAHVVMGQDPALTAQSPSRSHVGKSIRVSALNLDRRKKRKRKRKKNIPDRIKSILPPREFPISASLSKP